MDLDFICYLMCAFFLFLVVLAISMMVPSRIVDKSPVAFNLLVAFILLAGFALFHFM